MLRLFLVGGIGFVAGGLTAGLLLRPERSHALANPPASPELAAPLSEPAPRDEMRAAEVQYAVEPAQREEAEPSPDALLGAALMEFARTKIGEGWGSVRNDIMPEALVREGLSSFEELVKHAPHEIGKLIAEREARRELAKGDPVALLDYLAQDSTGPVLDVAEDPEAMQALLNREVSEHYADAGENPRAIAELVAEGVTLSFPAGVFQIDDFLRKLSPFPRDVSLVGAGMNATLFVLRSGLGARNPLERFAIRDCTVFTQNDDLFDHRRGGASIVLQQVRVIGFDRASGASAAFRISDGMALLARDCRFEGGYGRTPGSGNLIRVDGPGLVARFERCTISNIHLNFRHWDPRATVVFSDCRLVDLLDDPTSSAGKGSGVVFPGSSVLVRDEEAGDPPALDLNDLFPNWKQRMR